MCVCVCTQEMHTNPVTRGMGICVLFISLCLPLYGLELAVSQRGMNTFSGLARGRSRMRMMLIRERMKRMIEEDDHEFC